LGEVVVAKRPTSIKTVLGSCVAVILHAPRLKISALCHAQMPEKHSDGRCRDSCPHPCNQKSSDLGGFMYVTCCVRKMLSELRRLHVDEGEIVATLVGGANVLQGMDRRWSVADRNVAVAIATLEKQRIPIRYTDVGGTEGRTIEHLSDSNRTTVRYHRTAG
jgi:chemotaxis protein CheD